MNKDNAKDYLPLVQALAEDKLEVLDCTGKWVSIHNANFKNPPNRYRIKPSPVMIPLGPEDVPPGSVIRHKQWSKHWWAAVVTSFGDSIQANRAIIYWTQLQQEWEISRDGGKTWQRCEKVKE